MSSGVCTVRWRLALPMINGLMARYAGFCAWVRVILLLGVGNCSRFFGFAVGVRIRRLLFSPSPVSFCEGRYFDEPSEAGFWPHGFTTGTLKFAQFGWHEVPLGDVPPDWLRSDIQNFEVSSTEPWWNLSDFDPSCRDIKTLWEMSRFGWVVVLAKERWSGNREALDRLNNWLSDWSRRNPAFYGPNWKCGQEASMRVMQLALAAMLLEQTSRQSAPLEHLVSLHLRRIASTIGYALAQDNNHGTSEAAALFIGGSWLLSTGNESGRKTMHSGRKWLENRVARLIAPDGSFSQYSVNYHRVVLDTLIVVELWRRELNLEEFSLLFYERTRAATNWLYQMVDKDSGDAPNIGANDGAQLLRLSDSDYRDYRPSVQLASVLFSRQLAWREAEGDSLTLRLFKANATVGMRAVQCSSVFDDGGYAVLRRGGAMALLRYPRFRFRPSHADALHLDFWINGMNVLRDAGSYGYNADPKWQAYFPGTLGHNTVQFDSRDQMPRLGRFLFGDWLRTNSVESLIEDERGVSFGAGYSDREGASHFRKINLSERCLRVEDRVGGFKRSAVLRWRLEPGDWRLDGNRVSNGTHVLEIAANVPTLRLELVEGWESRYYLQKTPLPVLEIEVDRPGTLVSEYRWAS